MRFQTKAVFPAHREMVVGDRFKFMTPAVPLQYVTNPAAIREPDRLERREPPLDRRKYGFGFLRASQSTAEGKLLAERVSGLLTELPAELSPSRCRQFPA